MGRAGWLVLIVCASCVQTTSNFCADGTVCPGGFSCDVANHRCLLPEQTAACDGKQEADDCTVNAAPGACRSGACEVFYCGDGYVTEGEDCDGENLAGDTCKDFGFYGSAGLSCTDACTYDVTVCKQMNEYCGDGVVNGAELCDGPEVRTCVALGFDAGTASCDAQCGFTIVDCSRFGWNPESLSDVIAFGVAGASAQDQWAVGDHGAAMHFHGEYWNTEPTGVTNTLMRAWSNAANDTWAVGQSQASPPLPSVVIHYDGSAWSVVPNVPTAEYIDIWGTSASAMWVATSTGVLAYDGLSWTPVGTLSGTPTALRGTSATDLWVATSQGPLLHWNGNAWTDMSPPGASIQFIDANAPDDVWAIGFATADQGAGVIAHWIGTRWEQWTSPQTIYNVVASSAPNDCWVGGVDGIMRHWDGMTWSSSVNIGASPSGLTALSGLLSLGPSEVVGVSTLNLAYRYRGQTFGLLAPLGPNPFDATDNTAMWGPEDSIFATNLHGEVWKYDGTTWSLQFTVPQGGASVKANDVWGASTTDVYVAADDGNLYHYDGNTWTPEQVATGPIQHVWGSGPGDVWAFAGAFAFHKNGATWDSTSLGVSALSVSGSAANNLWVVESGTPNQLWHWDGAMWSQVATGATTNILAVAAVAPDDVHVSATQGRMLHFNGSTWSETIVPALADITFLAYTAKDDVIGASARDLLSYNGEAWSNMRTPVDFVPNTADYIPIAGLHVLPSRIDIMLQRYRTRTLIRTKPLICRATEDCNDGVDNDCDGLLDGLDPDCP
jgi:hypothetical protein